MPPPDDTDRLTKLVMGALRDCINVHGPITKDLLNSATKRIVGQLKNEVSINSIKPSTQGEQNGDGDGTQQPTVSGES